MRWHQGQNLAKICSVGQVVEPPARLGAAFLFVVQLSLVAKEMAALPASIKRDPWISRYARWRKVSTATVELSLSLFVLDLQCDFS